MTTEPITRVELVNAEVLKVKPGEVLVIKGDFPQSVAEDAVEALNDLGLEGRVLLISTLGLEVDWAVAPRDSA